MLHGNRIENTLFGGPAFGHLMQGDIIFRIDGQPVSEQSILSDLRGSDVPGSKVVLTILRSKRAQKSRRRRFPTRPSADSPDIAADDNNLEEIEVIITRMATAEIADRRAMFDHFTFLQVLSYFFSVVNKLLTATSCAGALCYKRRRRSCS
jgi:hypothetical protein